MASKKHVSRARRKNNLLKSRLDFQVTNTTMDSSEGKNISQSKLKEETTHQADEEVNEDEEFVHEFWEDRADEVEDSLFNTKNDVKFPPANDKLPNVPPNEASQCETGRSYPQDLWFLLGNHIRPESVQTFGRLCHGSWEVLKTFKFWASLYERTYAECRRRNCLGEMKDELKVSRVVRPLQVKYHVIKALFAIYPPFKEILERQKLDSVDFDQLKGYKPKYCWRPLVKNCSNDPKRKTFLYNLLLEKGQSSARINKSILFNNMSEAAVYNPDKNSAILRIITDFPIPNIYDIMGLHLIGAKYNTTRDMRHMRLELDMSSENFHPPRADKKITLDPVKSVQMIKWWHPIFPNMSDILINDEEATSNSTWDSEF